MEMLPQFSEILSRAASDEGFRRKLESDPVDTLRRAGLPLVQRYDIDYSVLIAEEPAEMASQHPSDFKWTKYGWCFFMLASSAASLQVTQIKPLIDDAFNRLSFWQKASVALLVPSLLALIMAGILEWRNQGKQCGMYVRTFFLTGFWSAPGCGPHP